MPNRALRLCWIAILLLPTGPVFSAQDPQTVVRQGTDRMLQALRANQSELARDKGLIYGLVRDILVPHFDFPLIAQYVLGKSWARATEVQRKTFEKEFSELLIRTYALALLNYAGEEITHAPVQMSEGASKAKVGTKIHSATAQAVSVDYRLHLNSGAWKVYDVTIDGVSLVATYRKGFATQITRSGLDGLIGSLAQRNAGR